MILSSFLSAGSISGRDLPRSIRCSYFASQSSPKNPNSSMISFSISSMLMFLFFNPAFPGPAYASFYPVTSTSSVTKNLRQYRYHFFQLLHKKINFFLRIIHPERDAHRSLDAEALHQRLGTVVAGSYGYAIF